MIGIIIINIIGIIIIIIIGIIIIIIIGARCRAPRRRPPGQTRPAVEWAVFLIPIILVLILFAIIIIIVRCMDSDSPPLRRRARPSPRSGGPRSWQSPRQRRRL